MLYRDGFYEASIVVSRSVCEMICYDLLSKLQHPFGDLDEIEVPMYRAFVNFLAIPKNIERNVFEECVTAKISDLDQLNFIKSAYSLDKPSNTFQFKIGIGHNKNNLERLLKIFRAAGFEKVDNFRDDTLRYLHRVYDIGNIYVHTKKSPRTPKEDAIDCLNILAHIFSDIFGVTELKLNELIKSGYSDFPDVCNGMNFGIPLATSPLAAQRVYFNLPSQEQEYELMQKEGIWKGEWKNKNGENEVGVLTLSVISKEHLTAYLQYSNRGDINKIEPLEIRLFGNYFHLIGFDEKDGRHKKGEHVCFELEFFNENFLLGQNIDHPGKVMFQRA